MTAAFPLTWPPALKRTPPRDREDGRFKSSMAGALKNVRQALEAFGRDSRIPVSEIVLSSNVTLGAEKPPDPGVAVWFLWDGDRRCIAVDRYTSVEANLQAIFHVLEARRTEVRHGTLNMVRATFAGLKALPPPADRPAWRKVLGFSASSAPDRAAIEEAFKRLARDRHPDRGGSADSMAELNRARDEALQECGA